MRIFSSLVVLAFTLGLGSIASAEEKIVVKVGTVAPEGTPWSEMLKRTKRRFKKESEKKIKLKVYFGGRLGGEKEMLRETREGRIQMWGGSTGAMATIVPEMAVLESPYLFDSDAEADFVLDKYAKPHVEKLLAARGFVFYQFSENGWHGLALKDRCVESIDDLAGKKIRSQEAKIHLDTFKAMGANPVEMAVPEVLPALKQGVVDGFSNTPLFSFATSWYQGVSYFTDTNHIYQPAVIVYSKKWFDKQPANIQKILLNGAEGDTKFGRNGVRAIRQGLLDNFTKSKIKVCKPSAKLLADLKAKTKGIFAKYEKNAPKKNRALFKAIRDGKAAWAKQK